MSRRTTAARNLPATRPPALWTALAAAGILAAGFAAWSQSFHGPFIFDDHAFIDESAAKGLWPLGPILSGQRPVVQVTLALNYLIGGSDPTGYHIVNLSIHLLAALALFGIVRRTFLHCRLPIADCRMMAEKDQSPAKASGQAASSIRSAVIPQHSAIKRGAQALPGNRQSKIALILAFCAALLWVVHPLQTQAVTYIIQRMESLMGMFYFLTLYCFIRAATADAETRGRGDAEKRLPLSPRVSASPRLRVFLWQAAAVAACALGMGSKEVMVSAPLIVLLYDRCFIAGSFGEALRRRGALYLGLAATWLIIARSGLQAVSPSASSAGFGLKEVTPSQYAISQPGVILYYLRLAFWPAGLCLDYDWPVAARLKEIAPGVVVVGGLLAATVWALIRKPRMCAPTKEPYICAHRKWGFLGAWFFLILAPTSSFMPIKDLAFEHRMYLPLAAVVMGVLLAAYRVWERLAGAARGEDGRLPWQLLAAALVLAGALGWRTFGRNADYRDAVVIWKDTIAQRPGNARAWYNLGDAYNTAGDAAAAFPCLNEAIRLKDDFGEAYNNRGVAYGKAGHFTEAMSDINRAIKLEPGNAAAWCNRGNVYSSTKRPDKAIADFERAVQLNPNYAEAYSNLGAAYNKVGRREEAMRALNKAIKLKRDESNSYLNRAVAYYTAKEYARALADVRTAQRLGANPPADFLRMITEAAGRSNPAPSPAP